MMKSKKKKRKLRLIAVLVLIGVGLLLGGYLYINSLTYKTCYAEAGVEILPRDFFKKEDTEAVFTEKSQTIDIHMPGEYTVYVKSGLFTHKCNVALEIFNALAMCERLYFFSFCSCFNSFLKSIFPPK